MLSLLRNGRRVRMSQLSHRLSSTLNLPPIKEWVKSFPANIVTRDRVSIHNPQTADALIRAFGLDKPTSQPKTIIEGFPGPGVLTRALLRLPPDRIKKIIVLEENKYYLPYLLPLEKADPRVSIVQESGYLWESYSQAEERGLLDEIVTQQWGQGEHPQLHFVSGLPQSVFGEQLISQLLRSIPERQWLFKYGKVPLHMIIPRSLWERMSAPMKTIQRCKLGVIADATAHCSLATPLSMLTPLKDHVFPDPSLMSENPAARVGTPLVAINVFAKSYQIIDNNLDMWDYVLRKLYVLKSRPFNLAISVLAPGATILLDTLANEINIKKPVRELTIEDWSRVVVAFANWPFAPKDLHIPMMGDEKRLGS